MALTDPADEDPLLRPARMRLLGAAGALLRSEFLLTSWRVSGLRLLGAQLGSENMVLAGVRVTYPPGLRTGSRFFVNVGCMLDSFGGIDIGDDVSVGPNTSLLTTTHEPGTSSRRAGARTYRPVRIGHGVWLGASVTVLPGVSVGDGCVVGAGSVVTADLAPDHLYAGSPARQIRALS